MGEGLSVPTRRDVSGRVGTGLEPKSRRPRDVRQPQTPLEVVQRIQALREQYPGWGREKLRVLLLREGIAISAKSIDRVIARLKARGVLREPLRPYKAGRAHRERLRRPPDLVVDRPGVLMQMDSKQVQLDGGKVTFQFGALDCFTRKRVVALAPRLTSQEGAAFAASGGISDLERVVATFPFPVQAIQSDGGSEFLGVFGPTAQRLSLAHYFNRPNYPQGNGRRCRATARRCCATARVERSFRTDEEEFYQVQELSRHVPTRPDVSGHVGTGGCSLGLEPGLRDGAASPSPRLPYP